MDILCPKTGRRLSNQLRVYNEHQMLLGICDPSKEIMDGLRAGLYLGVGSKRRITHLILQTPDDRKNIGTIPMPAPTAKEQQIGDARVWEHSHRAHQWLMIEQSHASSDTKAMRTARMRTTGRAWLTMR